MAKKQDFSKTIEEIKRLTGGKRERAERLLEKAAFMDAELQKLQKELATEGWVEVYQNGANQSGLKKSSKGEVYISLGKNYSAVMRTLDEMLSNVPDESDEIENEFFK